MENRQRKNQLKIRLNDEEKKIFMQKLEQSKIKNMNYFIRKCILENKIFVVDSKPFYKIQSLLSNATKSLNQIAKRINYSNFIHKNELENIQNQIDFLSKEVVQIHSLLLSKTENKGDKT